MDLMGKLTNALADFGVRFLTAETPVVDIPSDVVQTGGQAPRPKQAGRSALPKEALPYYREALNDPTVAFVTAFQRAPLIAAEWTVTASDRAPAGAEQLIADVYLPMRELLIHDMVRSIDYGFQGFEVVWEVDRAGRQVPRKFKPLLPEATLIDVVADSGAFAGLRNMPQGGEEIELAPINSLLFTHDMEAGNFYGRSVLENIRRPFLEKKDISRAVDRYNMTVSGPILVVRYPRGSTSQDSDRMDNAEIAQQIAREVSQGVGVAMPSGLREDVVESLAQRGVNPAQMDLWRIESIMFPTGAGAEYVQSRQYNDTEIARGLLTPERAIMQGQHGTLAEAEAHQDVALVIAQARLQTLIRQLNWYSVDDVLARNFGESARGSVELTMQPIEESRLQFLRQIAGPIYTGQFDLIDLPAVSELLGVPLRTPEQIAQEAGDFGVAPISNVSQDALDGAISGFAAAMEG